MLIINKKLSKKGLSLIELMVAVVILAMAIFGIFNAFSSRVDGNGQCPRQNGGN